MYGCGKDCLWFSFHLGCHRSVVSHLALNISPLTQTVALLWDRTLTSVPPAAAGRSSPTNTPVFPPSPLSYWVLRGSIYSFPLVKYSCLLSAGILHALLCLKVYSWCICGDRCTLCPPTPLPSCSPKWYFWARWWKEVSVMTSGRWSTKFRVNFFWVL